MADAPMLDQTLAEIIERYPRAISIFRAYRLDFSCGGDTSLREAAQARLLPVEKLISELSGLEDRGQRTAPNDLEGLIDDIVARFHEAHRRQLPALIALSRRIEANARGQDAAPCGLTRELEKLAEDLLCHLDHEERTLFPRMRAGDPSLLNETSRIRDDHQNQEESLEIIELLTNDFCPPPDANDDWRSLCRELKTFVDELMEHIHTENNVLLPLFEKMNRTRTPE